MATQVATEDGGLGIYAAPDTLAEAVRLAAKGDVTVLAGGTDLMPRITTGKAGLAGRLINIRRIPELGGIDITDGSVRLGALVTVTEILESDALRETAPVLAETADCFASGQLRNMSTIGGNVCNASPAGDMIIPLLLLDAEAELASWADGTVQTRLVPLGDFFTAPGKTVRQTGEVLAALHFPVPPAGFAGGFRKFGPRPALEIAMAAVGIAGVREGGRLTGARVAFGAVAPTPMRGPNTEAAIEGRPLDADTIAAACVAAAGEVTPISDVRASAWYRTHLVRVMTEELLTDAANG